MTTLTLLVLGIAVLAAVAGAVRGPDLVSRVIALDVGVIAFVGFLAVDAVSTGTSLFLDVLPLLGLLAVLATLAARWVIDQPDHAPVTIESQPEDLR